MKKAIAVDSSGKDKSMSPSVWGFYRREAQRFLQRMQRVRFANWFDHGGMEVVFGDGILPQRNAAVFAEDAEGSLREWV